MRAARERCAALCHEYNRTAPWEAERRGELLRQLIGRLGEGAEFTPPFWCGYGYNISAGEGFTRTTTCGWARAAPSWRARR